MLKQMARVWALTNGALLLRCLLQVILRWALQKGYNIIPGSGNPKHQEDNLAIYSLELSGEEMAQIDSLRDNAAFMYAGNKPLNAAPSTHQA